MNSLQRSSTTVGFGRADRVPVIAQIFGHAARLSGVPLGKYLRDGELLARCQMTALKRYEYDAVFALMDTSVETEAAGAVLRYREDTYPFVETPAVAANGDIENLRVPDPAKAGRMPELIRAARILRREVGDDVLVVGCALGPMTIAVQLMGGEKALYLAADNPVQFCRVLDFTTEVCERFASAQLEAGAHLPVIFEPAGSPAFVPPAFFREFILPRLARIFTTLKKQGSAANWLHIAGPTKPILPLYAGAGVDIANFDYSVTPEEAQRQLPKTCLDGNIKPLSFVCATPDAIRDESLRLLQSFERRGGFILSSGCEIPPESKPENIEAMVQAARRV